MTYNQLLKKLKSCGGDCHHCQNCIAYCSSDEKSIYMAVGCKLSQKYGVANYVCSYPDELHQALIDICKFELEL